MDITADVRNKPNAMRVIIATMGVLCGLTGLEHGFFEALQGNVRPGGLMIDAIQPSNRFWPDGAETAFTIIPNFLLTGILAMIIGLVVINWSITNVHKKFGALVLFILLTLLFLVGGGFGQVLFIPFISAAATQINSPLRWWRQHISWLLRQFFGKFWLVFLFLYSLLVIISAYAAIFGYIPIVGNLGSKNFIDVLMALGYSLLVLLPLSLLSGIAHDSCVRDTEVCL